MYFDPIYLLLLSMSLEGTLSTPMYTLISYQLILFLKLIVITLVFCLGAHIISRGYSHFFENGNTTSSHIFRTENFFSLARKCQHPGAERGVPSSITSGMPQFCESLLEVTTNAISSCMSCLSTWFFFVFLWPIQH